MWLVNYGNVVDPLLKGLRKIVADLADLKPGQRVLDVCCGTGTQVIEFGRRDVNVTGIDLSAEMLKIAEKNILKDNNGSIANISFKLADAASLPFSEKSFDIVSVSFGLHDKTNKIRDKVVSEMIRVVKSRGSLVIVDFTVPLPRTKWGLIARSLEFLVGGSHYAGFKDFTCTGGLDYILKTHKLQEERRARLVNGLVTAIKAGIGPASC